MSGNGERCSDDAASAHRQPTTVPTSHNSDTYQDIHVTSNSTFQAGPTYQTNYYSSPSEKEKAEECLQAFKTSQYEAHKDRNPSRVHGTCGWVLNHPHFQSWRNDDQNALLWISADPGCGKSVLAKALADEDLRTERDETICYFFFKDNEEQDNLALALCALLHQLFVQQRDLISHAMTAWEQNGLKLRHEYQELWRILVSAIADRSARSTICVLDALDECRDNDRRRLIGMLSSLQSQVSTNATRLPLKFVVTSRPYENVERWFYDATTSWPEIRLRGEDRNTTISQEINLVLARRVEELSKYFQLSNRTRKALHSQMLQVQHRTYLWLHLAVEEARQTYAASVYPDEEEIPTLPSSVEDAYERLLQKITDKQNTAARQVLLIIIGARRPLTVPEMASAMGAARAHREGGNSIKPPQTHHLQSQIRHWCGLFVFIQQNKLFLIHQTAKEFLLAREAERTISTNQWRSTFTLTEVEREMANVCTTYLLQPQKNPGAASIGSNRGFWQYCAETWASHAQSNNVMNEDTDLCEKAMSLSDPQGSAFSWFAEAWKTLLRHRFSDERDEEFDQTQLLTQHVIAFNGHTTLLRDVFSREKIDVDMLDGEGNTAIMWAAGGGHLETVQMLLGAGADVNKRDRRTSALHIATVQSQEQIVQILLQGGAEIDAQDFEGHTALYRAAGRGFDRTVQILLQAGANVNFDLDESNSPLRQASHSGHEHIVRMLLQAGATVELQHRYDGTPLQVASRWGHEQTVQVLIQAGADVNASDSYIFGSALQAASQRGHERVVRMLLQAGANVNHRGGWGGTALKTAKLFREDAIVQILLEAGAIEH